MNTLKIYSANIVTPEKVIYNGTVVIKDDKITEVLDGLPEQIQPEDINAKGSWVLPG